MRFDCASGDRTDPWAHMQLDALGLFLTAYGTLAQAGHLAPDASLVRAPQAVGVRSSGPETEGRAAPEPRRLR